MTGSEERPTATFSLRFPGSSGDVWRVCSQHASDLYHMTIKLCKEQVTVTGAEGTSLALLAPPPLLTHTSQLFQCKHPSSFEMAQRLTCSGRLGSASAAGGAPATVVLAVPPLSAAVPACDFLRVYPLPSGHRRHDTVLAVGLPRPLEDPVSALRKRRAKDHTMNGLPFYCQGEVVKGFGRGSKELGIPTGVKETFKREGVIQRSHLKLLAAHTSSARVVGTLQPNFPEHVVDSLPDDLNTGIYYGWGCVGDGDVHKMVMSIGWNPFYKNTKKSVETHIIHHFQEDFYGEMLSIIIVGYIRPERSFDSLDALIAAINSDIEEAKKQLDLPEFKKLKDRYFNTTSHKIMNGH
uniref:riboflavin kinase n=1 Tax=Leptobrachium leishanense TaxID=445787 RepID=A0A8C5MTR6_9ANUR